MLGGYIWPDIGQANRPKAKTNHVFIWPDIGQDKQTTKPNNATALPIANPKCTSK